MCPLLRYAQDQNSAEDAPPAFKQRHHHPPVRLVGEIHTPQREKIGWKSMRNKYEIVMGTWKNIISFLKLFAISSNGEAWRRCGPTETPFKAKSLGGRFHRISFQPIQENVRQISLVSSLAGSIGIHPQTASSTIVGRRQQ